MNTVYIVTWQNAVVYASTDHTAAVEAAQNAADMFGRSSGATAHLLVTGWLGAAAVSTDHIYAQREQAEPEERGAYLRPEEYCHDGQHADYCDCDLDTGD